MATFNKYEAWTENLAAGVHDANAAGNTWKVMLSNAAPNAATHTVRSEASEISAGNGYTAGGEDIQNDISRTGGTTTITAVNVDWEASSGGIGPFRYVILYDDSPTSPADPLIGWWDYGSGITLNEGESFAVDFDGAVMVIT